MGILWVLWGQPRPLGLGSNHITLIQPRPTVMTHIFYWLLSPVLLDWPIYLSSFPFHGQSSYITSFYAFESKSSYIGLYPSFFNPPKSTSCVMVYRFVHWPSTAGRKLAFVRSIWGIELRQENIPVVEGLYCNSPGQKQTIMRLSVLVILQNGITQHSTSQWVTLRCAVPGQGRQLGSSDRTLTRGGIIIIKYYNSLGSISSISTI